MADESTPKKALPHEGDTIGFVVSDIKGLYVPFVGAIQRLIPNTPEAVASAQQSLYWSRAAWLN